MFHESIKEYHNKRRAPYAVGTTHQTSFGPVKILEHIPYTEARKRGFHSTRVVIEFQNTGYVCNVQLGNLTTDKVRDRRAPTVYGIGYLDTDIKIPVRGSGSEIRRVYDLWCNMLKRCYGGYKTSYTNVVVDKRWHSFKNFLNSVPELPGYNKWLQDSSMCLDKDTRMGPLDIYSKNTCQFITVQENLVDGRNRRWGRIDDSSLI